MCVSVCVCVKIEVIFFFFKFFLCYTLAVAHVSFALGTHPPLSFSPYNNEQYPYVPAQNFVRSKLDRFSEPSRVIKLGEDLFLTANV